ncbi:hypothetical protein PoMZ_08570 [Pyricularia oryzae]|uniref:Uncharacterized protein n=1 Tax=Pyricularia oryzae TaxID=318829 RepID=A0A4P7NI68_PYROR|nr:hypothetical protein PoMZ_08570 [Pyricularia oryzae]
MCSKVKEMQQFVVESIRMDRKKGCCHTGGLRSIRAAPSPPTTSDVKCRKTRLRSSQLSS